MARNPVKPLQIPLPVNGETQEVPAPEGFANIVENFDVSGGTLRSALSPGIPVYEGRDISGFVPAGDSCIICDEGRIKFINGVTGETFDGPFVGEDSTLDYAKYNDAVYFATKAGLYQLSAGVIRPAGVQRPPRFPAVLGGPTLVAVSLVDSQGVESGAVPVGTAKLGDTITIPQVPAGHEMVVYVTDKSEVYREVGRGVTGDTIVLSEGDGAECQTLHMDVFPAVDFVTWRGGRLYAAAGNVVYVSAPFNPSLRDVRYGHFEFSGNIRFLKYLGRGVLVGDDNGIWYLSDADNPSISYISSNVVPRFGAVHVDLSKFPPGQIKDSGVGVVVLTEVGHVLFTPSLQVIRLTQGNVRMKLPLEARTFYVDNNNSRRVVSALDAEISEVLIGGQS